jgi:hypothetical protein
VGRHRSDTNSEKRSEGGVRGIGGSEASEDSGGGAGGGGWNPEDEWGGDWGLQGPRNGV